MCDEPDHKNLFEIIGDQIADCLPERLRNDEEFRRSLGSLCGFVAGCVVAKTIIELLFGKGDKK
jgi:hypothetical protein